MCGIWFTGQENIPSSAYRGVFKDRAASMFQLALAPTIYLACKICHDSSLIQCSSCGVAGVWKLLDY
ncbi:hypothetical protein WAI453_011320 [Rhynchosporium graminicola]